MEVSVALALIERMDVEPMLAGRAEQQQQQLLRQPQQQWQQQLLYGKQQLQEETLTRCFAMSGAKCHGPLKRSFQISRQRILL